MKAIEEYNRQVELTQRSTKPEQVIRELLDKGGIEYIQNYPVKINDRCTFFVDFYLIDYNCYLEIDGGYHNTPEQKKKDIGRRSLIYNYRHWLEIRIQNRRCFKLSIGDLFKMIKSASKPPKQMKKKKKRKKKHGDAWSSIIKKYPDPNKIRKH